MKLRKTPTKNSIYKHFKGGFYRVLCIAEHTENKEKVVVYKALYGDYKRYARPLNMFMSEVDHEKYPDVQQKYRFEEMSKNKLCKYCVHKGFSFPCIFDCNSIANEFKAK